MKSVENHSATRQLFIIPLKYALVGSILNIVLFFVILFFDENPLAINKGSVIITSLIFVFFSIKEYKSYYNQGILHFWQGMTVGFLTSLLIAGIVGLFVLAYLNWSGEEMLQEYVTDRVQLLTENKENFVQQFGEEMYRKAVADIKMITPQELVWEDIKKILTVDFFVCAVVSVIMRRVPSGRKAENGK